MKRFVVAVYSKRDYVMPDIYGTFTSYDAAYKFGQTHKVWELGSGWDIIEVAKAPVCPTCGTPKKHEED